MNKFSLDVPLDLFEVRRQLVAMRSLHSNNKRVATAINRLLGKLSHLQQPENRRHEERLLKAIARSVRMVEGLVYEDAETSKPNRVSDKVKWGPSLSNLDRLG
jgi:hypothetical protein